MGNKHTKGPTENKLGVQMQFEPRITPFANGDANTSPPQGKRDIIRTTLRKKATNGID